MTITDNLRNRITSLGMANGFYSFVSNRHGKFYASFAPMCDGVVLGVTIMGPYQTERQAQKISDKWTRLNKRQMAAGEALSFANTTTVPQDVRVYITESITAAIKQGIVNPDTPDDAVFGPSFQ
jgi:hypothetical protein